MVKRAVAAPARAAPGAAPKVAAPRAAVADRPAGTTRVAGILERVCAIPEGFVRTYGDIDPAAPRLVGHVLAMRGDEVPWHRVVRADGTVPMGTRQMVRLRREGVPFRGKRVDLAQARIPR